MIIGTALNMTMMSTIVLAVSLGFVFGFALGIIPLLRAGYTYARAFKQVFIAEGLSIAVMETAEVLVQLYTPRRHGSGPFTTDLLDRHGIGPYRRVHGRIPRELHHDRQGSKACSLINTLSPLLIYRC